jgi:hypothetical protein
MVMSSGQPDEYRQSAEQGQDWPVQPGMMVQGADGMDIGRVNQVDSKGGNILVERSGGSELAIFVPLASIQDVSSTRITLSIPADQVDQQGWEEAPIPGINP